MRNRHSILLLIATLSSPFVCAQMGVVTTSYDQHAGGNVVAISTGSPLEYSITATPNSGFSFHSWSDGVTDNPRIYTHNSSTSPYVDRTFYAVFTKDVDLTFSGGHVNVAVDSPTQPSFTLTAVAQDGVNCAASFYLWNNGLNTTSVSYVESDGQRFPYFVRDNMLIYEKDEHNGNLVNVDELECGYTLTAVPASSYRFLYWDDDHTNTNPIRDVDYLAETYTAVFSMCAFRVGSTYYPTYEAAEPVAVSTSTPIDVVNDVVEDVVLSQNVRIDGNGHILNNLYVPMGKKLNLGADLYVNGFFMEATTSSSSQLVNKSYLTSTNAYIDITLEVNESVASPDKWYAFAVPFEVDVANGIRRQNAPEVACTSAVDYLVWEYDGALRAATGNGWRKMLGGTLYPGRFYMIGIDGTQNTWRFARKSGSALGGSSTMDLPPYVGSEIDGGWNAVANPTLQYVTASVPGIPFVQVYDNKMSRYLPLLTNATSFVVACPFFVQVDAAKTMILTASNETNPNNLYAPQRYSTLEEALYEVHLSQGDDYDVLFVSADDDASYSYEVGKDLLKMGFNSNRLQLFTMLNNGNMLCVENRPFVNGAADFPIYILAPQAGDYTLSVSDGARAVYLLENGMPIANITGSEYTLRLQRGMTTNYALRIGENQGITTDVTPVTEEIGVQKIILDNQLYIIHNQNVYNATGVLMR